MSARVVVAGGGFAAVEALLALRELLGERVEVVLVSPRPTLEFRPAATVEAFADVAPLRYDLPAIAAGVGAVYRHDRVEAVAADAHQVRLASFERLGYDALVLALGTRPRAAVAGALTFRDQRDVPRVRSVLRALETGAVRRLALAVPAGVTWPLPLYELALQAATRARGAEITVVSPERSPLEALGTDVSTLVARLLAERDVRFCGASVPAAVRRDGALELRAGAVAADRVIAVPELRGPRISGVPGDWSGFVAVDGRGRVEGLHGVHAVGDITRGALKHGGLAAHQADVAAADIAASLGAAPETAPGPPEIDLRLAVGDDAIALRLLVDQAGRIRRIAGDELRAVAVSRAGKVVGRYLSPYLATQQPLTA